ncbi:transcriptional regulator with XRE-family HTH domain [Paenibacillus sp. V4I3]|uniref:helix-turn-helix domain-containing protein n=1 Tax=Paenibacillus sp. V4I3 TaxID=3042305 RepID=UPI0027882D02|nr:helix-turn-helix transcriptional regulator [Paenibacillus sp. V4I3]MDQ0873752.1 transcriptional regulator with XRE-family HTH domain [Paenibacillus sp. V4I3]
MFAKRIEQLREREKITQKNLALKLGIARTTYSGYENGAREPDLETLKKIADYFEVSTDFLVGRTDDPNMYFSEEYKKLHNMIDLNKPEDIKKVKLTYKNMELTNEEKMDFLAIAQGIFSARRSLNKTT